MDAKVLKKKIYNEDKYEIILESLGMHHIKKHDNYYSCGMPDGDNISSTIVYTNENCGISAYTRDINGSDIISLVCFIKNMYFSHAIKYMCDICGFSYYGEANNDIPKSLIWLDSIIDMNEGEYEPDDMTYIDTIDELILKRYGRTSNQLFYDDGISDLTQYIFELGVDMETHSITIPIRDELENLVGVKVRKWTTDDVDNKYYALHKFAKTKVLYGLDKTYKHIVEKGYVYVFESEKSVMKAWDNGIKNSVAILGHKLSKTQAEKLGRLGVKIILCYDQEVGRNDDGSFDKKYFIKQSAKFLDNQELWVMFDNCEILENKESPVDNFEKFEKLKKKIRRIQ